MNDDDSWMTIDTFASSVKKIVETSNQVEDDDENEEYDMANRTTSNNYN